MVANKNIISALNEFPNQAIECLGQFGAYGWHVCMMTTPLCLKEWIGDNIHHAPDPANHYYRIHPFISMPTDARQLSTPASEPHQPCLYTRKYQIYQLPAATPTHSLILVTCVVCPMLKCAIVPGSVCPMLLHASTSPNTVIWICLQQWLPRQRDGGAGLHVRGSPTAKPECCESHTSACLLPKLRLVEFLDALPGTPGY